MAARERDGAKDHKDCSNDCAPRGTSLFRLVHMSVSGITSGKSRRPRLKKASASELTGAAMDYCQRACGTNEIVVVPKIVADRQSHCSRPDENRRAGGIFSALRGYDQAGTRRQLIMILSWLSVLMSGVTPRSERAQTLRASWGQTNLFSVPGPTLSRVIRTPLSQRVGQRCWLF